MSLRRSTSAANLPACSCSCGGFSSSSVPSAASSARCCRGRPDRACRVRCLIDSASAAGRRQERLGQRPREQRLGVAGVRRGCRRRGAARSATARRRPRPRRVTASTSRCTGSARSAQSPPTSAATSGLCRCRRISSDSTSSSVNVPSGVHRPSGRAGGSVRRRTPPCRCAGWPRPGSAPRCSGRGRGRVRCSGCRRW